MPKRRANGEGSIFKRKDGLWAAQYTDNAGKKRTLYGKSQQIVKDKLKEAIRQSDKGLSMDKNNITFASWLLEWLEVYAKPTCRQSTYAGYYNRIHDHIIPAFPKVLLKDLRADMLQKFINEKAVSGRIDGKEGGLSPTVLHSIKMIISSALKQAEENGIINDNAAKKIKMLPKIRKDFTILTKEEQKRLEDTIIRYKNLNAFAILLDLHTGLRIGELLALKVTDIDFDIKEINVKRSRGAVQIPGTGKTEIIEAEPKTSKGKRTVPLNDAIITLLTQYVEDRYNMVEAMRSYWTHRNGCEWEDDGHLFLSWFGNVTDQTSMRELLNRVTSRAGIKEIKFHALRHTFATRCLESGFDIRTLADIMGHADVSMTLNVYSHAMPDQKRINIAKLSTLFDEQE